MYTLDIGSIPVGQQTIAWLLEWTTDDGYIISAGQGEISLDRDGWLDSSLSGGTYHGSSTIGGLKVHSYDGNYYLAIFPDEASMRVGAQVIVDAVGDDFDHGLFKEMTEVADG